MVDNILHIKLKIEQHEPQCNGGKVGCSFLLLIDTNSQLLCDSHVAAVKFELILTYAKAAINTEEASIFS
jgi:hypothetical protein